MIELMYVALKIPKVCVTVLIACSSARGNTSLESAVSLTKSLRWDIQALGQRLAIAATAEELTRRRSSKAKSKEQNEHELKLIVQDIRKLLNRIEDAVPLINLAITTSGASLSTNLPSTVSPSRLLQASTFLTAGDTQYSIKPSVSVQIGPTFTLSMYMLFLGHLRPQNEEDIRQSTWKEVIHKARVKLVRVPLDDVYKDSRKHTNMTHEHPVDEDSSSPPLHRSVEEDDYYPPQVEADAKADEYAYQLVIVEDLDDDRMHTFDDAEVQPGPYDGVEMAGIRESIPIHEISKIFYADTGKILNIGSDGETNSPVLLLKRDINAIPPRRMMERFREDQSEDYDDNTFNDDNQQSSPINNDRYQQQSDIDAQLDREHRSSSLIPLPSPSPPPPEAPDPWRLPLDLDPEWLALEVYTEASSSDTDSIPDSSPAPLSPQPARPPSLSPNLTTALSHLNLVPTSTPASPSHLTLSQPPPSTPISVSPPNPLPNTIPTIRTSLSLLETLLRLSSLQQFQQQSHLSITDELLNFFLSDSPARTTGPGPDAQDRIRLRHEATSKVGFDPYDESPVKRRGEAYQSQQQHPSRYDHDAERSQPRWAADPDADSSPGGDRALPAWSSPPPMPPPPQPRYGQDGRPSTPATPPLLLKDNRARAESSPEGLSAASYVDPRPHLLPCTPPKGAGRGRSGALRREVGGRERRGSPLAGGVGPRGVVQDEGLGTSPASGFDGEEGKEGGM